MVSGYCARKPAAPTTRHRDATAMLPVTARLSKASTRLDEVTKRLIQVHMQIKELELRFREAVKLVRIPARA
jgi:hypothetical protein